MKKNTIVALHPKAHPNLKVVTAWEPMIISASLGERLSIAHHIEQEAHGLSAAVCFFEFINQRHPDVELVIALPNQGKSKNHTRAFDYGGPVADYFSPQQVTVVFFEAESSGAFYQSLRDQRSGRQMILHQWVDGSERVIQDFPAIDTHYCAVLPTQQPVLAAAKQGEELRQVGCDLHAALRTHEAKWLKKERSKSLGTPSQSRGLPTLLWAAPLLFTATYCLLWGALSEAEASSGYPFSG